MTIGQLRTYIRNYTAEHGTKRFLDKLQSFVDSMNNRPLERLRHMSPIEVVAAAAACFLFRILSVQIDAGNQWVPLRYLDEKEARLPANSGGLGEGDTVRLQITSMLVAGQTQVVYKSRSFHSLSHSISALFIGIIHHPTRAQRQKALHVQS